MTSRVLLGLCALAAVGCSTGQESTPEEQAPEDWHGVGEEIERFLQEQPLPGLSVAILKGSDVVFAQGYGWADVDRQIAVTPETMFPLGSVEKQFTAAAILLLAEEGRIGLHDPITRYLPRLDTAGQTITVDDMLHQVSGLQSLDTLEATRAQAPEPAQWGPVTDVEVGAGFDSTVDIGSFAGQPLYFPPRERFAYCQPNYDLLCYVIAALTDGTYYDAIDQLAQRAGLKAFHADWTPRPAGENPDVAHGYERHDDGYAEVYEPNLGSAWTTAVDLARWGWALDTGRVVSPESYAAMTSPATLTDGRSWPYGYGLWLTAFEGRRKIAHTGIVLGFYAALARYPQDDLTIALMTNVEGTWLLPGLEERLARLVFEAPSPAILDEPLPTAERSRIVGTYDAGPLWFDVTREGEGIAVAMRPPDVIDAGAPYFLSVLRYQGHGEFRSAGNLGVRVEFPPGEGPALEAFVEWDGIPSQAVRRPR